MADDSTLTDGAYERIREATRTYREELVVRLAGEVGLRPAEMAELRLSDLRMEERDGRTHYLLSVDGTAGDRIAYLPEDIADDVEKFARERQRAESQPVFDVSARRIQMLIGEVGDRVSGSEVSSRSLRRRFARSLLDGTVDPRIVQAVGGWSSLDTVAALDDEPTIDDVIEAFATRGQTRPEDVRYRRPGDDASLRAVHEISRRLGGVESRDDAESMVCRTLVEYGFDAVWIEGANDETPEPAVRAWAGIDRNGIDAAGHTRPSLDIPIVHGETDYGTMTVVAGIPGGFDILERESLSDLGRRLGQAIAAVSHRRLLLADSVVELDFVTRDTGSFLVETARKHGCSLELEGLVPVGEHSLVLYVTATDATPETIVDEAQDAAAVTRARLIRSGGGEGMVEMVVSGGSPTLTLTELGGNVTEFTADGGGATVTAEFPTDVDVRGVVEGITAAFPDTELVAKRETSKTVDTSSDLRETVTADLTDKQHSVLRAAYLAGYFDWPRGTTAEELADALDISSPTLHNHLRKAQRSVLDELFADDERAA